MQCNVIPPDPTADWILTTLRASTQFSTSHVHYL